MLLWLFFFRFNSPDLRGGDAAAAGREVPPFPRAAVFEQIHLSLLLCLRVFRPAVAVAIFTPGTGNREVGVQAQKTRFKLNQFFILIRLNF